MLFDFKKMAHKVYRKTHEDLFLEVTLKKVFMILVGENLWVKIKFGQIRAKTLRTPKHCLLLHL